MSLYDDTFRDHHREITRRSAEQIVPEILALLEPHQPSSVVDLGCGDGQWLASFENHGIKNLFGIEGPWIQDQSVAVDRSVIQVQDLAVTLQAGGTLAVDQHFDLAISLEVGEHLPESVGSRLVNELVRLAPVVVFSAAIPGQGGTGHVNEQWPTYWVQRFRRHGYAVADVLRPRLWSDDRIAWWYAQNLLIFVDGTQLDRWPLLREGAATTEAAALAIVHPTHYRLKLSELDSRRDPTQRSLTAALREFPATVSAAFRRHFSKRPKRSK